MRIQKNKALLAILLIVLAGAGLWYVLKPAPTKLATPTAIPVRVVTVSDSGTSPTVTEPPGTTQFAAAGFISTPIPISPIAGPKNTSTSATAASLR